MPALGAVVLIDGQVIGGTDERNIVEAAKFSMVEILPIGIFVAVARIDGKPVVTHTVAVLLAICRADRTRLDSCRCQQVRVGGGSCT